MNDIIVKLNKINFKNLEGVKIGLSSELILKENKSILKSISFFLCNLFSSKFASIDKKITHLFFFSPQYNSRKDHLLWVDNLAKNINHSYLYLHKKNKIDINIYKIYIVLSWLVQINKIKLTLSDKLIIITNMKIAYDAICNINNANKKNRIRSITVICDVHLIDNILVQYYNIHGFTTVSLQHGIYSSITNPISIVNSKSQYLLVYGKQAQDECRKLGMESKKIKIIGMPQLLLKSVVTKYEFNNNFRNIGIIFDGGRYINNDLKMLNQIVNFNKKYGCNINIKLHPSTSIEKYDYLLKNNFNIFYKEITAEKFIQESDIIICSKSTVFISAMLLLKPVYLFKNTFEQKFPDLFPNEEWCSFSTHQDLEKCICNLRENCDDYFKKMIERREYYTNTKDVRKSYIKFYNQISGKDF